MRDTKWITRFCLWNRFPMPHLFAILTLDLENRNCFWRSVERFILILYHLNSGTYLEWDFNYKHVTSCQSQSFQKNRAFLRVQADNRKGKDAFGMQCIRSPKQNEFLAYMLHISLFLWQPFELGEERDDKNFVNSLWFYFWHMHMCHIFLFHFFFSCYCCNKHTVFNVCFSILNVA